MNKYVELINVSKVGKTFKNLKIEGLDRKNSDCVLQEIARNYNKQFSIEFSGMNFYYTLVKPSKKFMNKTGQWSMYTSDKVKEYLKYLDIDL